MPLLVVVLLFRGGTDAILRLPRLLRDEVGLDRHGGVLRLVGEILLPSSPVGDGVIVLGRDAVGGTNLAM